MIGGNATAGARLVLIPNRRDRHGTRCHCHSSLPAADETPGCRRFFNSSNALSAMLLSSPAPAQSSFLMNGVVCSTPRRSGRGQLPHAAPTLFCRPLMKAMFRLLIFPATSFGYWYISRGQLPRRRRPCSGDVSCTAPSRDRAFLWRRVLRCVGRQLIEQVARSPYLVLLTTISTISPGLMLRV